MAVRETVLTTGQHLFTMFVDICKEMNLDWKQNLVGQLYDGAALMRGAYNGLQSIVKTHTNTYFEFEKLVKLPVKLHQLDNNFTDVLNSDDNDNQNTDEDSSEEDEKPQDTIHMLFEVCNRSELKNIFPSLYTALCISLILPVSSASPERAFSKLKLIKTRLRSTMCEERLESLMMISCEKDIPIDTDEVIKCFSSYSPVLLKLLT